MQFLSDLSVVSVEYCRSMSLSMCVSMRQPWACPRDNLWPTQVRISTFGPEVQHTLFKIINIIIVSVIIIFIIIIIFSIIIIIISIIIILGEWDWGISGWWLTMTFEVKFNSEVKFSLCSVLLLEKIHKPWLPRLHHGPDYIIVSSPCTYLYT